MSKIISALERRAFSLRTRAQAVPRTRVTPTAIPTVVQLGPHIANMHAVVAADLVAHDYHRQRLNKLLCKQ